MAAVIQEHNHSNLVELDKTRKKTLNLVIKEPFFHFIFLGFILFAVSEYIEYRYKYTTVNISQQQINGIADNYRLQYGHQPTAEQLNALVESFIKEEVYYREALRLNLNNDDEIIRRRLVQKFEFLQQDLGTPEAPTEADLLSYFEAHKDQYRLPKTVSFSHIYFSPDVHGQENARKIASQNLERLNTQNKSRAPELGDNFSGLYDYVNLTEADVIRVFGRSDLSHTLFNLDSRQWQGPFASGLGWHLIRISHVSSVAYPDFHSVIDAVRHDYVEDTRKKNNAEAYEKLKKDFDIVIG